MSSSSAAGSASEGLSTSEALLEGTWRRSSYCSAETCVQVKHVGTEVIVGDSKSPDGPVLTYSEEEWQAFVEGVKDDEFDL